jgi:phospholipase/carboxylesterase
MKDCLSFPGSTTRAVALFHGYGADMHDLAGLREWLDPEQRWHWYFPNGPLRIPMGGYGEGRAWFPIDMAALEEAMRRGATRDFSADSSADFLTAVERAEAICQQLQAQHSELVIGGFSQGAMVTSHVAARGKISLKGLVLLSGNLVDRKLLQACTPPVIPFLQSHGEQDAILGFKYAEALFALLTEKGMKGTWVPFRGGHEIPMPVLQRLKAFLELV